MGNAQSQEGQPTSPHHQQGGTGGSGSGKHHHHFSHSSHHGGRRGPPQRKNSLSAASSVSAPLKAAPTTSTSTIQDPDLLISAADIPVARGTPATSSIGSATEKLTTLSVSAAGSTDSSTVMTPATGTPSGASGGSVGGSVPKATLPNEATIAEKIDNIISIGAPAPGRRRNSFGSATTVDTADLDEMNIDDTKAIPTALEWTGGGNKVYVTGTFSGWKKKFRLIGSEGHLTTVVPLPPGTHHLKFLVDGQMKVSDMYPTAVDAAGILVNYIEVLADDLPPLERQLSTHSAIQPPELPAQMLNSTNNSFIQLPIKAPKKYTSVIPAYLEDLEERQEQLGRSLDNHLPPPPSLPMILSKVILNGATTMRDDSSVLPIPNHVVLNHLATSSIKNQVLAISATTRYKKKYVSTILYKSTSAAD